MVPCEHLLMALDFFETLTHLLKLLCHLSILPPQIGTEPTSTCIDHPPAEQRTFVYSPSVPSTQKPPHYFLHQQITHQHLRRTIEEACEHEEDGGGNNLS